MKVLKQKKYWIEHFNDEKYVQLREKVLDSFKDLVFEEGPHKYYLHGKEITCVSNVTHKFKPHFDVDAMAQATYERNFNNERSKYYKMTPEMIKESWEQISKEACSHGTERHEFAESIFYFMTNQFDKILPVFKDRLSYDENTHEPIFIALEPKEIAAATFYEELPDSLIPILAETKVYSEELGYSGTFDLLMFYDAEVDGRDDKNSGLTVLDWKGLDIDTPIFTKNKGWVTMGTIEVGDIVFDKEGSETKVLHTSSVHNKQCYKIKFDNNTEVIADFDHRWEVFYGRKIRVMTSEELFKYIESNRNKLNDKNSPKIHMNQSLLSYNNNDLNPYMLGEHFLDENYLINQIFIKTYNKILKDVLLSDYEYKKQVLFGLMDSYGNYNSKNNKFSFVSEEKEKTDFVVQLLSSMGIKCEPLYANKRTKKYEVVFSCNFNPFTKKEIEIIEKDNKINTFYNIVSIEKCKTVPTRCIEVDSPTHTFLFGHNFITTHNTNKDLYKNFKDERLLPPFEGLQDMPLSIYKLQLSLYQICLEKIGLKTIARRIMWLLPNGTYDKIPLESYTKQLEEELIKNPIK